MAKITVKDVAREASVSFATAAAALRGAAKVRDSTRARVIGAAKKLGYTRCTYAAMLSSESTGRERRLNPTIGWLTCSGDPPQYPDMWKSLASRAAMAGERARARGWLFHHRDPRSREELQQVGREWTAIGVDAVVLGYTSPLDHPVPFPWEKFVTVSTETSRLDQGFDLVRPAHFHSVIGLLREVRGRGYRRIGIWLREHTGERLIDDDVRLGASVAFQVHEQEESERIPVLRTDYLQQERLPELKDWLREHRPEVVVATLGSDLIWITKAGLRVPGEMAFAALHVSDPTGRTAGVLNREDLVPDMVFDFLDRKLRLGTRGLNTNPQEVIFHTPFVEGASLPRKPPRPRRRKAKPSAKTD